MISTLSQVFFLCDNYVGCKRTKIHPFFSRSQDQLVVGSVQSAGAGVVLTQPLPVSDNVPCELSFTAHPMSDEFCIKNIVIVSEARNVELYVDGGYAKTARGIMLTIRKGRSGR